MTFEIGIKFFQSGQVREITYTLKMKVALRGREKHQCCFHLLNKGIIFSYAHCNANAMFIPSAPAIISCHPCPSSHADSHIIIRIVGSLHSLSPP